MKVTNLSCAKPVKYAFIASSIALAQLGGTQKSKAQTVTPINSFLYDGSVKSGDNKVSLGVLAVSAGLLVGTIGLIRHTVKNMIK